MPFKDGIRKLADQTANITKYDITCVAHRQNVTVLLVAKCP